MRWLAQIISLSVFITIAWAGEKTSPNPDRHFVRAIDQLETQFKGETNDINKLVAALVKRKVILASEELDALSGMYYQRDTNLRKIFLLNKEFENTFARYLKNQTAYKTAKKAAFPAAFLQWQAKQNEQNRQDFKRYLISAHWFGKNRSAFKKMRGWLAATKFNSEEDERQFILRSEIKDMESIHHATAETAAYIQSDLNTFDWEHMKNNPRESRQKLRSIPTSLLAARDLFYIELGDAVSDEFDQQLLREYRDPRYLNFPTKASERTPLPQLSLLRATYLLAVLDNAKQDTTSYFYIVDSWKKYQQSRGNKISREEARDYVEKHLHIRAIQQRSDLVVSTFYSLDPLHDIIASIEQSLEDQELRQFEQ